MLEELHEAITLIRCLPKEEQRRVAAILDRIIRKHEPVATKKFRRGLHGSACAYKSARIASTKCLGTPVSNGEWRQSLRRAPYISRLYYCEVMGVDPNALIESTEQQETERMRYSMRNPGFRGEG